MRLIVGDGLAHVEGIARSVLAADPAEMPDSTLARRRDLIIVDVNSQDVSLGMAFPPQGD